MKRKMALTYRLPLALGLVLGLLVLAGPARVQAQDVPQRQLRTYIPPDQLVSFLPSTPFNQFVEFINPIFERVTGKEVIDPEGRVMPIGISIAGYHFLDALELVLEYHGLNYRETDGFFLIEEAVQPALIQGADQARAGDGVQAEVLTVPATLATREIQINAILFELDHNVVRETGVDWSVFFGEATGTSGGGESGGGTSSTKFFLKTDDLFKGLDDVINAPDLIDFTDLTQFFRLLEREGFGETVASPQVTVQSREQGRIQIGTDIPVQVRDFAGNTVTQFFSTGIIIDVVPTLITQAVADSAGAPTLDFIHLNVKVENSNGTPSPAGIVIDRNLATTQVLLLDGEQTIIGGLFSTEEAVQRSGIPVLKDLPPWFFGLRYLFGRTERRLLQKELLIVLQARVLDSVPLRALRPLQQNILESNREHIEEQLRRFSSKTTDRFVMPTELESEMEDMK